MCESNGGNTHWSGLIKLTADNYSIWKTKMEDFLYYKDLYDHMELGDNKPTSMSDADWKKMYYRKAISIIGTWVDLSDFHHVAIETNAQVLWQKLEKMYEIKTTNYKIFSMKKLVNLKYTNGKSIMEHLSDFKDLVNCLSTVKLVLDDELQALLLLNSLPNSWKTLVVSVCNSALSGVVTLSMVEVSMFTKEMRRKEIATNNAQTLATKNRSRSKNRGAKGHSKSKERSQSRKEIICYHCH